VKRPDTRVAGHRHQGTPSRARAEMAVADEVTDEEALGRCAGQERVVNIEEGRDPALRPSRGWTARECRRGHWRCLLLR
jgi:hypothetical protein